MLRAARWKGARRADEDPLKNKNEKEIRKKKNREGEGINKWTRSERTKERKQSKQCRANKRKHRACLACFVVGYGLCSLGLGFCVRLFGFHQCIPPPPPLPCFCFRRFFMLSLFTIRMASHTQSLFPIGFPFPFLPLSPLSNVTRCLRPSFLSITLALVYPPLFPPSFPCTHRRHRVVVILSISETKDEKDTDREKAERPARPLTTLLLHPPAPLLSLIKT